MATYRKSTSKSKKSSHSEATRLSSVTREQDRQTIRETEQYDSQDHNDYEDYQDLHLAVKEGVIDKFHSDSGKSVKRESDDAAEFKHAEHEARWLFEAGRFHDLPLLAFINLAYQSSTKHDWRSSAKRARPGNFADI